MRQELLRTAMMHACELTRFLQRQVSDAHDAQDLMQELYLAILKAQPQDVRHAKAYLFAIAANLAYQHRQRRKVRPQHLTLAAVPEEFFQTTHPGWEASGPESEVVLAERVAWLGRRLDELSPKVRAAVVMHHRDGYTCAEIAEELSVVTHRVKKYLTKGIAHCRTVSAIAGLA